MQVRRFPMTLWGYDRSDVDALLDRAMTEALTAEDLRSATFRVALRGYDRVAVDIYIEELEATRK